MPSCNWSVNDEQYIDERRYRIGMISRARSNDKTARVWRGAVWGVCQCRWMLYQTALQNCNMHFAVFVCQHAHTLKYIKLQESWHVSWNVTWHSPKKIIIFCLWDNSILIIIITWNLIKCINRCSSKILAQCISLSLSVCQNIRIKFKAKITLHLLTIWKLCSMMRCFFKRAPLEMNAFPCDPAIHPCIDCQIIALPQERQCKVKENQAKKNNRTEENTNPFRIQMVNERLKSYSSVIISE